MTSRRHPLLAGLGFLALTAGCAGATDSTTEDATIDTTADENTGYAQSSIKGGYKDTTDSAVVGIYDDSAGGLCSGSLIAPNLVLTARHCVSATLNESADGGVLCGQTTAGAPHKPKYFYVTTKPSFPQSGNGYHTVREVVTIPVGDKFCGNDQAILILSQNIDPSEAVPLVPRVDSALVQNEEYNAIGYGATADSGAGAGTRRRRDGLFVSCVADACPSSFVKATEWVGDTGICSGDSGGPAIDLQNRVVGVTSRGSSGCDSPVYGYVFGWGQWIKDTAVYAAGLGGYEPPPWATGWPTDPAYSMPIGDTCAQPADCESDRCVNDGVAAYCTRLCDAAAPCPDGWTCDEANLGVCMQVHPPAAEAPKPVAKKKVKLPTTSQISSCSVEVPGEDPTKPIPWFTGAGALAALAWARRRRHSA